MGLPDLWPYCLPKCSAKTHNRSHQSRLAAWLLIIFALKSSKSVPPVNFARQLMMGVTSGLRLMKGYHLQIDTITRQL
jgi:hypothetical protein